MRYKSTEHYKRFEKVREIAGAIYDLDKVPEVNRILVKYYNEFGDAFKFQKTEKHRLHIAEGLSSKEDCRRRVVRHTLERKILEEYGGLPKELIEPMLRVFPSRLDDTLLFRDYVISHNTF